MSDDKVVKLGAAKKREHHCEDDHNDDLVRKKLRFLKKIISQK